jgi:hypothetical protein
MDYDYDDDYDYYYYYLILVERNLYNQVINLLKPSGNYMYHHL